jgi:hypothetical protein
MRHLLEKVTALTGEGKKTENKTRERSQSATDMGWRGSRHVSPIKRSHEIHGEDDNDGDDDDDDRNNDDDGGGGGGGGGDDEGVNEREPSVVRAAN